MARRPRTVTIIPCPTADPRLHQLPLRLMGGRRGACDFGDSGVVIPVDPVADAESESGGEHADGASDAERHHDGTQRYGNIRQAHRLPPAPPARAFPAHFWQTPKMAKCSMSAWNPCFSSSRARSGSGTSSSHGEVEPQWRRTKGWGP